MRVQVTENDIKHGVKSDSCRCPVAMALARALGRESRMDTHVWCAHFEVFNGPGTYVNSVRKTPMCSGRFPRAVSEFIHAFDHDHPGIAPFEFDVTVKASI